MNWRGPESVSGEVLYLMLDACTVNSSQFIDYTPSRINSKELSG